MVVGSKYSFLPPYLEETSLFTRASLSRKFQADHWAIFLGVAARISQVLRLLLVCFVE